MDMIYRASQKTNNYDKIKKYACYEILRNTRISENIYDLVVRSYDIASFIQPGQFAGIYIKKDGLLLPRPISICESNPYTSELRFVYRTSGKGTEALSYFAAGSELSMLAPLGNGFPLFKGVKKAVLVGGGIGVPPLLGLANAYRRKYPETEITAILGFKSESILAFDFEERGIRTFIATESGINGFKGNTVELITKLNEKFDVVYSCGPKIMMKNIAAWAKEQDTPCYVSLEERMGCGFGVCIGCVCNTKDNNSDDSGNYTESYKKVCTDGPVFNAQDIIFD